VIFMKKKIYNLLFMCLMLVSCGDNSTSSSIPEKIEKIETITLEVEYDYGSIKDGKITVLFNSSYINFDLNGFDIPNDLIPGDRINIEYIGSMKTLLSYPGQITLDGNVKSVEVVYAPIVEVKEYHISRYEGKIEYIYASYYDKYVILDEDLNYVPLSEYTGDVLYASEYYKEIPTCPSGSSCPPKYYSIKGLFAYNPRP